MKKCLAVAALLLASTAAQAQYTFEYGGRTIRVDPDRGTVQIPGVYDNTGRSKAKRSRNDDADRDRPPHKPSPQEAKTDPQAAPEAPAPVAPLPAPSEQAAVPAAPAPVPAAPAPVTAAPPEPTTATAAVTPALLRDVAGLRRIITPQRDVISRLARREFLDISTEMSFRFRDVYDHLARIADDALIFQDRLTGILDAHLSSISNQLNQVMKVLAVVATIFMPLTLLTGIYGMNVPLPHFPGGDAAQFWWLTGISAAIVAAMLVMFRRKRWI